MKGIQLARGFVAMFFVASGALGFDGRGWWWDRLLMWLGLMKHVPQQAAIILKTLTLNPKPGNLKMWKPWTCVRRIALNGDDITWKFWRWRSHDGFVNAVGLTNNGFHAWLKNEFHTINFRGHKVVVSIDPYSVSEAEEMAIALERRWNGNIVGIELNASCPNVGGDLSTMTQLVIDMARAIKRNTKLPLMVKLGVTNDVMGILGALKEDGIIVDLMNTVPWIKMYPDRVTPLAHLKTANGGGVSGPAIIPLRDELYAKVRKEFPDLPILLSAGIWDQESDRKTKELNPDAVGYGTIFLKSPNLAIELMEQQRTK